MECTYCGDEFHRTSGKMLILNSGKKIHFCSSKCEKNWEKGRDLEYSKK
ncbi:MAG: 50S ribosomal protein L24e [Candidatus Nanohaloarchaeota archaeon QJJ-9]|nr:50S ribosomal protein L24e [Candidatus Nanohaloarchaeota archaeon QJJ-9]